MDRNTVPEQTKEITIPLPKDIEAEIARLDERRRHLKRLLRLSREAYGEDGTE